MRPDRHTDKQTYRQTDPNALPELLEETVYLRFNEDGNLDGNSYINLQGDNLERANTFKYLGATLSDIGDFDAEMTDRIQSGWKTGIRYRGVCVTEE